MYTLRSKIYGAINKVEEILPGSWWDNFTSREDPPAKLLVECIEPITRNPDKLSLEFLENVVNKVSAVMQVSLYCNLLRIIFKNAKFGVSHIFRIKSL